MKFSKTHISLVGMLLSLIVLGFVFYQNYSLHQKLTQILADQMVSNFSPAVSAASAQEVIHEVYPGAPVLGNPNAPVTVVEFGDFQCPFCKKFYDVSFHSLIEKYATAGKIQFAFIDYPFLGEESILAAEGGMCAQDQNKFWDYYNLLYQNQAAENQGNFRTSQLIRYAHKIALDQNKFAKCLQSHTHRPDVDRVFSKGQSLGVGGTPVFYINNSIYKGTKTMSYYQGIIDQLISAN